MNEPTDRSDQPPTTALRAWDRPTREQRFLLILLGGAAALSLLVGAGLIAAWRAGSIVVQVSEHGHGGDNVRLRVPAAVGHLALLCLPDRAFGGGARDRIFRHGEMRLLAEELERIPDGTVLVQVDSPREGVRISRANGMLLIHVDSDEENLRVEVPIKLAGAFIKRIERVARTHHASGLSVST
jgi:hypothetical protein